MPSLVSKEKSEELGRWAHNAYLEALAETEKNARKLDQRSHYIQIRDSYLNASAARKKSRMIWGAVIYILTFAAIWWAK